MSSRPLAHQQYPAYSSQHQQYYRKINKSNRSKSVEDFTTDILFDNNRIHGNNKFSNLLLQPAQPLNKRALPAAITNPLVRKENQQLQQPLQRNHMRYSVDNLLEIDTSYFNNMNINYNQSKVRILKFV